MIAYLAQLVIVCFGLWMLKAKLPYKLIPFFVIALCLREISGKLIPSGSNVCFTEVLFVLSIAPYLKQCVAEVQRTAIVGLVLMMFAATIIVFVTSRHYTTAYDFYRLFIEEMMVQSLVLPVAYVCVHDERDLIPAVKCVLICLGVLTVIGIINYMTKYSFWVAAIEKPGRDRAIHYVYADRFRVMSMFSNPFDYGFICMVMSYFLFFAWKKGLTLRHYFIVGELCCIFGVASCNCRTVHLCFIIGILLFIICAFELRRWLLWALILAVIMALVLPSLPAFNKYVAFFEMALDTNQRSFEGGSSLGMRFVQFDTVLDYISKESMFGRGKGFFMNELGWADKIEGGMARDVDLQGLEGVYLNRLLERGWVGFIVYILFYATLFISAFRRRHNDPLAWGLFASVIAVYFLFANMTGELLSVFPTMLICGITLKLLYTSSPPHDLQHSDSGLQA